MHKFYVETFSHGLFSSNVKWVWILLSKAVDNSVELQKALIVICLISEKVRYDR